MPLPRFSPRQLEAFVTVAELRSFSAAGQRLALTPSAVSQLVAELEGAVGFRLFDRSTRKVAVSSAGRDFLGPAQTALDQLRRAETAAADVCNRATGVVRVAATQALACVVLPAAIKAYRAERPKVVVRIRDAAVEQVVDVVASGDADLGLGPDRTTGSDVSRSALLDSPWVLWCPDDHPLAAKATLSWRDLRGEPLVAAGRDHERSVAQMRAEQPEGERIVPVEVVDNVTTALGLAAQGLALTLCPAYVGPLAEPLGLVMKRVQRPEVMRQVCLYRPVHRTIPPAAEGFAEFLGPWLREWDAQRRPRGNRKPRPGGS
ncbi:MAG TPA: LysR substrate-binding domain-containing protein [Ideonella sp.]|nr:LysR substrate-binding domain-containing protein [Ideonella sp.]